MKNTRLVLASALFIFLGAFAVYGFVIAPNTPATQAQVSVPPPPPPDIPLVGWAWSDNIGWVSFSCENDHDEFTSGVQGVCGTSDYGLKVNNSDPLIKPIEGYAWSDKIGWINFEGPLATGESSRPGVPNHGVRVATVATPSGDRAQLQGWARACSVFASGCSGALLDSIYRGDWDGWIRMSDPALSAAANCPTVGDFDTKNQDSDPANDLPHEVCFGDGTTALEGYAWGSDVIGWLQFCGSNCGGPSGFKKFDIREIRPR